MDVERIIDDIEQLQEMFEAPDIRPLSASDISAANRRHDEMLAHSPWFRLWQTLWRLLPNRVPSAATRRDRRAKPSREWAWKNGEEESCWPLAETHGD